MKNKPMFRFALHGQVFHIWLAQETYFHPRSLCVKAFTDDNIPFATLTTNLVSPSQSFSRAYVDVNNCPWIEQFLVSNDIATPVKNITAKSGYVVYPLYDFDLSKLVKIYDTSNMINTERS